MKKRLRKTLMFYLQMPIILSILLVLMNIYIYFLDASIGTVVTVFINIYFIITIVLYIIKRNGVSEGLVKFAVDYGQVQRKLLNELDLPYAILDSTGRILWSNEQFLSITAIERRSNRPIHSLFSEITKNKLPLEEMEAEVNVEYNEHYYRVVLKQILVSNFESDTYWSKTGSIEKEKSLIALYMYDETDIMQLRKDNSDQKLILGLLYIDNYEEALESIDEVRRSLLVALVDRKINKYMQNIDAIIKKIEKDKYFFVFKNQYLSKLEAERFNILEEIRTVNIGNEMSVTISMGLGINSQTYVHGYEQARAAIDLALGRGGDQVVLKDGEKIQYYGGKSASVEKSTRVKARVKAHALREFMEAKEQVLVMGHSMADVDSFGASVGIYRIAKTLNKKACIVLNDVTNAVKPLANKFVNNPDYGEEIIISRAQALDMINDNTMLVVVDVNKPSYSECPELITKSKTIVILDHHRQTGDAIENAALSYIEPYASSACEMVAEILQYIGEGLKLRTLEADAMYAGVMVDTNNFLTKTGVRTFEAAAYLRRNGADATRIRKLFRTDMPEYMTKAEAMASTSIFLDSYAFARCNSEGVDSPTVLGAQVANELMNINNIRASFVFTPYNNLIYISARSIDELNVQVVMEKLGGGGHMSVAGAQMADCTVEEAMQRVKDVLSKMTEEGDI